MMKKVFILFLILPIIFLPTNRILAADRIEINTASLQELDQITGVGPALAQRIIDARPFSFIDDLLKVKGIGEKTLQKIKDEGLAYVQGQTQEVAPITQPQTTTQTPPEVPITQVTTEQPPVITYPEGVIINEVLPAPEGADDVNEYIEIYNSNTADIDISGWKLQDIQGTPTTYIFPKDTTISANAYVVLKRPETNITLNNDEDGLNLITPDGKITDTANFTNAQKNRSYNKTVSGWRWSTTQTPSAANIITTATTIIKPAKKQTVLSKSKKTDNNKTVGNSATASITNAIQLDKNNQTNPWLLFLIALATTIISAIIILLIKFTLLNKIKRF